MMAARAALRHQHNSGGGGRHGAGGGTQNTSTSRCGDGRAARTSCVHASTNNSLASLPFVAARYIMLGCVRLASQRALASRGVRRQQACTPGCQRPAALSTAAAATHAAPLSPRKAAASAMKKPAARSALTSFPVPLSVRRESPTPVVFCDAPAFGSVQDARVIHELQHTLCASGFNVGYASAPAVHTLARPLAWLRQSEVVGAAASVGVVRRRAPFFVQVSNTPRRRCVPAPASTCMDTG